MGDVFATLEIGIIFEEYIMLIRFWTVLISLIRDDQRKGFTVPFDRFIPLSGQRMWLLNVTPLVVIEGLDGLICRVEAYFFILFFF